ncbi:MAG: YciI family protein [Woeseiaceae bacterium]|nr:YciI family protein [Woeseiaceae bacterium]
MAKNAPTVARVDSEVFLVLAFDAEGSADTRDRELEGHLDYVESHCNDYLVCGPLRQPGQPALVGSFFLVAAKDEGAARRLVEGDPYVQSGVYREISVHAATAAAGRFMGGVIWESAEAIRAVTS